MSIERAYNEWATTYDADHNRTRDLDQVITRRLLGECRFKSILEIGCGTGKNTALFAQIGERVQALDFSREMIEQARRKLPAANVEFRVTDITERWPCADASVDLVSCNLVLEHIEKLSSIFSEAARVLRSGGKFFVSELHPYRQYQRTVATFTRNREAVKIPAFVHHISDFLRDAEANNLSLVQLQEWWHEEDRGKLPRLVSLLFQKGTMS